MSMHQLFLHKMPDSQNVKNKNYNWQAVGNKCGMVKNDMCMKSKMPIKTLIPVWYYSLQNTNVSA